MRVRRAFSVAFTMMELEARRLRHDYTEIITRSIQPLLWLLVFGPIMAKARAIPTGGIPYLAYLTPGVMVQSITFISIFYGLNMIWEGESGILKRLLTTPIPRYSIVIGRASAASIRALAQMFVVLLAAETIRVRLFINAITITLSIVIVYALSLGLASLSIFIASFMKTRERFMGIGQAITMPLWFASNAIYPTGIMPTPLRLIALGNPLTYGVDALRKLLILNDPNIMTDVVALTTFITVMVTLASLNFRRIIE